MLPIDEKVPNNVTKSRSIEHPLSLAVAYGLLKDPGFGFVEVKLTIKEYV